MPGTYPYDPGFFGTGTHWPPGAVKKNPPVVLKPSLFVGITLPLCDCHVASTRGLEGKMAKADFHNVELVLGDPSPMVRQGLKGALYSRGFRDIVDADDVEVIRDAVSAGNVDLLICDAGLPGGDACKLTHDIRHHHVGNNPFVVIITLIDTPDKKTIMKVMNSGTDDVVLKPISAAKLFERLDTLARTRKRFVVTSDYIGPNRRPGDRTDPEKDQLIDIPNILRAKSEGHHEVAAQLREKIKEANTKINTHRISIQGDQIHNLITLSVDDPARFDAGMKKIKSVASEFTERLARTDFEHISELCRMLNMVIDQLRGFDDKNNVEILVLVGHAIALSFKDDVKSRQRAMEAVMLIKKKFETGAS